ncbi:hypothetical protein OQA_06137 [Escherichia coli SCI-07]|nr:hypothetical protein OQA_06137 [Escherichia coli SCI-07]
MISRGLKSSVLLNINHGLLPPTWHLLSVMVWLYHNANVYFSGLSALFCANKNDHRNGRIPPGKASPAPDIQVCYWPVIPDA